MELIEYGKNFVGHTGRPILPLPDGWFHLVHIRATWI